MDIPVSVTTHEIEVTVNETSVDVLVTVTTQSITVNVEYGLSASQVQDMLTKENIDGIKLSDSPEFADTLITDLKSDADGGSITAAVYDWFKAIYASLVDSSVKSFIIGLLGVVKGIAERVGILEDTSYLDRFKIPVKQLLSTYWFNAAINCGSTTASPTPPIDEIWMLPFSVSDDITIDLAAMRIYVASATGNMRIGIYEGNPFYPYTLVWQSEELSQSATGVLQVSCPVTLQRGKMYWFSYIGDNNTVRFYNYQTTVNPPIHGQSYISIPNFNIMTVSMSYGLLPTTLDGLSIYGDFKYFPIISLRKA